MDVCTIKEYGSCIVRTKNGKYHRDLYDTETGLALPAIVTFNEELWYKDGLLHREDKDENGLTLPAKVTRDSDIATESYSYEWYNNGVKHNYDIVDGKLKPAYVCTNITIAGYYDEVGNRHDCLDEHTVVEYWVHGVKIDQSFD